jgi:hypothetical protein
MNMTLAPPEFEEATASVWVDTARGTLYGAVSPLTEAHLETATGWEAVYSLISFSGMAKTAVTVSKFVARSFSVLENVQAVMAGESADVLHVWILITEWTAEARKQVYGIQKVIMKQLDGLHFDFYVVDLPEGLSPHDMVSDIPVIFNRADQSSTLTNSSAE